jgi:uncharacterized protein YkwD
MRAHALVSWFFLGLLVAACGGESSEDDRADAAQGSGDPDELYAELDPALQEFFDLINEERATHGVEPVRLRADLICAAQRHSEDIGPERLCQHEGTDGSSFGQRVTECGGSLRAGGETVACGQQTPRTAVDAWLGSQAGHREMMLGANRRDVGIGVADNYWTAVWAD